MKRISLLALLFLISYAKSEAQMTARVVRDSLFIPWELIYGPDDHVWFTQKNGYICRLDPASRKIDTLYHEASTVPWSEGGMLGMALHPSFATTPEVFVAYEYMQASDYIERVVKYTYSSATNTLYSPQVILDNITGAVNHNGCRLAIVGDKLFVTTGDATVSGNAQDLNSVNGKILRINLDGSIPADNPFPGSPVWSYGHRNSQGLVYVPSIDKLYSSEHGFNNDDELNIIQKGRNYGWPDVEGFCNTPSELTFCTANNVAEPLQAWTPTIAVCGIDYYDKAMFPVFYNSILMVTLKDENIYQLKLSQGGDSVMNSIIINGGSFGRLRDLCIGPNGNIFMSTSNSAPNGSNQVDRIIELYDPSFLSVTEIGKTKDVTLYPNPSEDYVFVTLSEALGAAAVRYDLTDAAGRQVMNGTINGSNTKLSLKGLTPGIYHIRLTTDAGKAYAGKILKQ